MLVILEKRSIPTSRPLVAAPHRPYFHMSPKSGDRSLFDQRAFSSAVMWAPIKAHAFTVTAEMQGPPALSSKRKRRRAHRAVHTSLGQSNAWRLCATARCPTDPNRATKACPTSLAPCLSPLGHRLLRPISRKVSSQQSAFLRILQIPQSFVQCHDWAF